MSELSRSIPKQDVPTKEQIAQRAYELYEQRGREPGREVEDWLAAEAELRNQNSSTTSGASTEKSSTLTTSRQRPAKSKAASAFNSSHSLDHQTNSKEF